MEISTYPARQNYKQKITLNRSIKIILNELNEASGMEIKIMLDHQAYAARIFFFERNAISVGPQKLVEAWQFLDSHDVTKFLKRLADIKCLANIMGILKNIVSYRLGNPHNNLSHVSAFHLKNITIFLQPHLSCFYDLVVFQGHPKMSNQLKKPRENSRGF